MKRQQFVLILVAAMLCVAATAISHEGPGRSVSTLVADQTIDVGDVDIWNNGKKIVTDTETGEEFDYGSKLHVQLNLPDIPGGWLVREAQVYAGFGPIPATKKGNPQPGQFPKKMEFYNPVHTHTFTFDLADFPITWGSRGERKIIVAVHADVVKLDAMGNIIEQEGAWAYAGANAVEFEGSSWGWWMTYECGHPAKGHFIDAPVKGLSYSTSVDQGVTGDPGPFQYWPGDEVDFWAGNVYLGWTDSGKRVSPLDIFSAGSGDPRVVNMARLLQSLNARDNNSGTILITPTVRGCLNLAAADALPLDFADSIAVEDLIIETHSLCEGKYDPVIEDTLTLAMVAPDEAQGNLEAGLNASGIFRKNVTKTEDWGENKQKLDVMPVYFPGLRSNGSPSVCCIDETDDGIDDCDPKLCDDPETDEIELCEGDPGVPYEEWRLGGDPNAEECDPRDFEDPSACVVTLIECRELAKPIVITYLEKIDIYDDQVKEEFWPGRFSWDTFTAVSRDDGSTWKRMNVSRMADQSSFELKDTGEPFPGSTGSPYLKINDNYILNVWESKYCKSGNPRYSINLCENPDPDVEVDPDTGCAIYCTGNPEHDTEVCEPDYPGDDDYYVTDLWGVRGNQKSVDYDEVDDVAELGIGEIPYSCLWAARGVIVTQKDLDDGVFASLNTEDDPETPDVDETNVVVLGDIIWFKPERITSGRRDVYIPTVGSARGAGFAIAWQEDPKGLRPGKGKGPGEGWSGAITNHKSDIWYTYISYDDFAIVDEIFEATGPAGGTDTEPDGDEGFLDKSGLGRPKAQVPFALPVRISDNDMVNTNTLKVEQSTDCPDFPDHDPGVDLEICFPEVVDGSFVPMDPEEIASEFCGHPDADPATCCDPDNHESDPNCEDLKSLFGNLNGTKRYAYMARDIDEIDNATGLYIPGGDGIPDYQYYPDRGGTLDLCDISGLNTFFTEMPGLNHERWFGFTNAALTDKLVCVSSDGRLLDGDVFASRPMLQLQPYTKNDGTKSAWALLAYEESKGLGHSLAEEAHEEDDVNIIGVSTDDSGQEKPIKQDLGKNMLYHSFDFSQPDLVHPGHIVNLPALCGGLYPAWCDDPKTPDVIETNADNPTCTCEAGQPIPLYFDYLVEGTDPETDPDQWIPDETKFLQYRTEIARRARFLMQSPGKMGDSKTLGAIIFKQGQEGQGRPADAFIRRFVKAGTGNPYKFENIECTTYLDETFTLPACSNGAGDKPSAVGYNCNIWGEASGDRLCGGTFPDDIGGYPRRDHINLTSSNIDLAVDAGPDDETPDDPTDDRYGTNKVLLWSQAIENLGDESYGLVHDDGTACDVLAGEVCPAMYSNVRSHRGFIRGDFFTIAYALSPNWAASRNGNDRYNFYTRRSFDGGQTWTTNPDGYGVYVCPEFRTDPNVEDPDGSGNLPPEAYDATCGTYDPDAVPDGELPPAPVGIAMTHYLDPMVQTPEGVPGQFIAAGAFEPARNVSEIKSNKYTSADPRMGTTPPTYPLDGTSPTLAKLCPQGICEYIEDDYVNNMFFVAWGTADNAKSTGGDSLKTEASPLDVYYTRSEDYGDNYFKVPWEIGGANSKVGEVDEIVWRYDYVAKGEPEEQGECQLRATPDGSKMYVIWHSMISAEEDPDVIPTRWYPWKPSESHENDIWFSRKIFWPDVVTP